MNNNSAHRPPSYPSSKCILQYLNFEKRFQLSQRCPSIRSTERATPLKLHQLHIKALGLQVNDTTYQITTIKNQRPFQDSCGMIELGRQTEPLSGELLLNRTLTSISDWESTDQAVEDGLKYLKDHNYSFEAYDEIRKTSNLVQYLICKKLSLQLPFIDTIRLTISKRGLGLIHRKYEEVFYTKSSYDALKYLLWKFFDRKGLVTVGILKISPGGPLRLPASLKVRAQNLKVDSFFLYDLAPLESLIDMDHLKTIELAADPLTEPFILRIPTLILSRPLRALDLNNLTHPRILFTYIAQNNQEIVDLAERWLNFGKRIGTLYTFRIYNNGMIPGLIKDLKQLRGGMIVRGPK